jgi:hypothetical protein
LERRAQTLPEMLIASAIAVVFFTSAMGIFVIGKVMYESSMAAQELQRGVDGVVATMIRGIAENGTKAGIRSAKTVTIPSISEADFVGTDGTTRKFYLGSGGIVYDSPQQSPNPQTIYTTPSNSTITLRFWKLSATNNETVGIYLAVSRVVSGKTVSGSLQTYVNIKNMRPGG